jgi:hypothetical protein
MRRVVALILLLGTPATLAAQRMGFAPRFHGRTSGFHGEHFRHFGNSRGYYPLGLFDPYYADYFDTGYPVASQPPLIVVQPQAASVPEPPAAPMQPLMIELQGDRYVQVSGDQSPQAQMIVSPAPAKPITRSNNPISFDSSSPAILIFRDGHREEVTGYTIADGRLYVTSNYLTTGFWIQYIELSTLNMPETIAANSGRPHPFRIPSSPNEVIVGP